MPRLSFARYFCDSFLRGNDALLLSDHSGNIIMLHATPGEEVLETIAPGAGPGTCPKVRAIRERLTEPICMRPKITSAIRSIQD
ncbi:hypothetical protein [Endozoicomonas sp. SESOKO3]|uniref:hypothetical protein n=1 Tax=Endozoicomonas sp. SESOKO3 TaxID=2828744 RepID=UPI0021487529|nr:hypothetical protein [Endozoicomonas sp. SESOKO3]